MFNEMFVFYSTNQLINVSQKVENNIYECNCSSVLQVCPFDSWRHSKLCDKSQTDKDGVLLNSYIFN